ncbi:MAG: hypothetical protein CFE26_21080 [Verrucomicrobiales bacterium VVV1]|nr:MAG: hypothetical protein CFE26_21080 [Verrucomicrobiales bacterium VVV1]
MIAAIVIASTPACLAEPATADGKTSPVAPFRISTESEAILERCCLTCHDEETQKGDIRLDNLGELELPKRLDLLNRMQEQIYFQNMPPKQKRQPSPEERKSILATLSAELGAHHASTLEDKLQKPEFGNYVDHEKLFSGEFKGLP